MESAHAEAAVKLIEAGADRDRVRFYDSSIWNANNVLL